MLIQNSLYLILNFVGIMSSTKVKTTTIMCIIIRTFWYTALATSCQASTHLSEYAYRDDSVNRAESGSANCRSYPAGHLSQENYIHCDGTQLQLADSNLGQEQYQAAAYYQWIKGREAKLLFIFSTKISLTTITLHYYSDSHRGLPRLTFYAVPDDRNIWDALATSYPHVNVTAVPPGGEQVGRRNVSINVNFSTKRVLMYKYGGSFLFSVSEVEFATCK